MFPDVQALLHNIVLEVEVKKSHHCVFIAFLRHLSLNVFFLHVCISQASYFISSFHSQVSKYLLVLVL